MTNQEFSNAFDTLLNSYNTQAMFGEGASKMEVTLDEYEKSVFLTQAQDYIVKSFFDRTLNYQGQGIDDSTRRQIDFSTLIKVGTATKKTKEITTTPTEGNDTTPTTTEVDDDSAAYDARGKIYTMPSDVLFILNEKIIADDKSYVVVPINYKEYDRLMSKAYTQPLKKQAWRLFQNDSNNDSIAEIVPDESVKSITSYKLRYIKRPSPIVLVNLASDNLSIDGVSSETSCKLNPILHMEILNKAFDLAISSRGSYADAAKKRAEEVQNKQ